MDLVRYQLVEEIIDVIETTYREYVEAIGARDHWVLKRGFLSHILATVQDDPMPDRTTQLLLIEYLKEQNPHQINSVPDDRTMIENMFIEVGLRPRSSGVIYKHR